VIESCATLGALYVIVEYCPHGSLRSHLIKKRPEFMDTMNPDELDDNYDDSAKNKPDHSAANVKSQQSYRKELAANNYIRSLDGGDSSLLESCEIRSAKPTGRPLTTRDLVCYAYQIARGMEYLSSRKVYNLSIIILVISEADSFNRVTHCLN